MAESGLRRFFAEWPRVTVQGAAMWKVENPKQLHKLLKLHVWDGRAFRGHLDAAACTLERGSAFRTIC
eukprot:3968841-Pleurochrysis_carterae.AAC.1